MSFPWNLCGFMLSRLYWGIGIGCEGTKKGMDLAEGSCWSGMNPWADVSLRGTARLIAIVAAVARWRIMLKAMIGFSSSPVVVRGERLVFPEPPLRHYIGWGDLKIRGEMGERIGGIKTSEAMPELSEIDEIEGRLLLSRVQEGKGVGNEGKESGRDKSFCWQRQRTASFSATGVGRVVLIMGGIWGVIS